MKPIRILKTWIDIWINVRFKHFGLGLVIIKDPDMFCYTRKWNYEIRISLLFIDCAINF